MKMPLTEGIDYPEVFVWASHMHERLEANKDKGHWRDDNHSELFDRVREELNELEEAMRLGKPAKDVVLEAADVANMAFMAADSYLQWAEWNNSNPHCADEMEGA